MQSGLIKHNDALALQYVIRELEERGIHTKDWLLGTIKAKNNSQNYQTKIRIKILTAQKWAKKIEIPAESWLDFRVMLIANTWVITSLKVEKKQEAIVAMSKNDIKIAHEIFTRVAAVLEQHGLVGRKHTLVELTSIVSGERKFWIQIESQEEEPEFNIFFLVTEDEDSLSVSEPYLRLLYPESMGKEAVILAEAKRWLISIGQGNRDCLIGHWHGSLCSVILPETDEYHEGKIKFYMGSNYMWREENLDGIWVTPHSYIDDFLRGWDDEENQRSVLGNTLKIEATPKKMTLEGHPLPEGEALMEVAMGANGYVSWIHNVDGYSIYRGSIYTGCADQGTLASNRFGDFYVATSKGWGTYADVMGQEAFQALMGFVDEDSVIDRAQRSSYILEGMDQKLRVSTRQMVKNGVTIPEHKYHLRLIKGFWKAILDEDKNLLGFVREIHNNNGSGERFLPVDDNLLSLWKKSQIEKLFEPNLEVKVGYDVWGLARDNS